MDCGFRPKRVVAAGWNVQCLEHLEVVDELCCDWQVEWVDFAGGVLRIALRVVIVEQTNDGGAVMPLYDACQARDVVVV